MRASLLFVAFACGSSPVPRAPIANPASVVVDSPSTPCDEGLQINVPAELVQDCVDRRCAVELPIQITNCSDVPQTVTRVDVAQPETEETVAGVLLFIEFAEATIAPGDSRSRNVSLYHPGNFDLVVHRDGERTSIAHVAVHNPERAAALEACDRCNGDWGPVGMAQVEACNCRTQDAGAVCRSSADCEGACLFTGSVRTTEPPAEEPECTAWVMEGQCSDRSILFGCRAYLRAETYSCTRPTRAPYICVD